MFYSHFVYIRDGPLSKIWLAAHIMRQLKKQDITSLDITKGATAVMGRGGGDKSAPFALRICGQLLYGLTRIYQKKVELVSEDAKTIQHKLENLTTSNSVMPSSEEKVSAGGRSRKSGKVDLDASELRGRDAQITLHDHNDDEAAYANLGTGLDFELLDPMELDGGFVGEEWEGDVSILGPPHAQFDANSGIFQLTGNGRISEGRDATNEGDQGFMDIDAELAPDEAGDLSLDGAIGGGGDNSLLDEGRKVADQSAHFDLEGSILKDPSNLKELHSELDLGGGGMDDFGELLPPDSKPPSIAADEQQHQHDLDLVDAELDARQAELEQLKLVRAAAAAKKKRKAVTAFVPQIDDTNEIPREELRRWIQNPDDIVQAPSQQRGAGTTRTLSQNIQLSQQQQQVDQHHVVAPSSAAFSSSFDLAQPSNGLGQGMLTHLNPHTRSMLSNVGDIGMFHPKLLHLLRSQMTLETRLPGLHYKEEEELENTVDGEEEKKSVNLTVGGGDLSNGFGNITMGGMDELAFEEFGAGGGGEDPFTQDLPADVAADHTNKDELDAGVGDVTMDQDDMPVLVDDIDEEKKEALVEEEELNGSVLDDMYDGPSIHDGEFDSNEVQKRRSEKDVQRWWSEDAQQQQQRTTSPIDHESGLSKRTHKMRQLLSNEFKKTRTGTREKPLSFHKLIDGHVRAVAGGSFYQLLVLSSRGMIQVEQKKKFEDIQIIRTEKFDQKLTGSSTSQQQESQMSEVH